MKITSLIFALFIFCSPLYSGHPDAAMSHAAERGNVCKMAEAISYGANIDHQYDFTEGRTPLMATVISGNWNAVNFLLRIGANPKIKNNKSGSNELGWTALDYAEHYKANNKYHDKADIRKLIKYYLK